MASTHWPNGTHSCTESGKSQLWSTSHERMFLFMPGGESNSYPCRQENSRTGSQCRAAANQARILTKNPHREAVKPGDARIAAPRLTASVVGFPASVFGRRRNLHRSSDCPDRATQNACVAMARSLRVRQVYLDYTSRAYAVAAREPDTWVAPRAMS